MENQGNNELAKNEVVILSEKAKKQLLSLLKEEDNNPDGLRISLAAGGCSGLSYQMDFDKKKENDLIVDYGEIKIMVDPKSSLYIYGLMLDYEGGLNGKGFVFSNPNAQKSCGCGTSFSVGKDVTLEFINKEAKNVCPSSNQTN